MDTVGSYPKFKLGDRVRKAKAYHNRTGRHFSNKAEVIVVVTVDDLNSHWAYQGVAEGTDPTIIGNVTGYVREDEIRPAALPLPKDKPEQDPKAAALVAPLATDTVVKPSHYTRWKIEPITFTMLNNFEGWRANIVKYVSRAGFKLYPNKTEVESEIIDLQKTIRYAEMRINMLLGKETL